MAQIDRRAFLKAAGLGAAALGASALKAPRLAAYPLGIPVGLQLYTVRKECDRDLGAALQQVAAIGYRNVEIGGTDNMWGRQPRDLRKILCDNCLVCVSAPVSAEMMTSDWQKTVDQLAELGALYAVGPGEDAALQSSLDAIRRHADLFNRLGEQCQKSGLRLAFHCHNRCFRSVGGTVAYDVMLQHTDPRYVDMELDCFWTTLAGKDPVAYFHRYPGRFALLHIKDLKSGFGPTTGSLRKKGNPFTEVGRGIIHWKRIFAAAREGGLRYYMVEQDECDRPPLASIKISYEYLKNLVVA
jgi:sugar phosphate isomerase/epimerase